jgi:hypothetical protein
MSSFSHEIAIPDDYRSAIHVLHLEEASYVVYAHHTAGARVHYVRALRLANSGSHVRTVSRATWSLSRCCLDPDKPVPGGVFAYPRA